MPSTRRRRATAGRLAAALVVGAGAVYVVVCLVQVMWAAGLDQARPVQVIVVLGSAQYDGVPSPDLEARLAHALILWSRGYSRRIVCTGGKEPGDAYTEAHAEARWLSAHGVPDDDLILTLDGRDTWESLAAAADVLRARHIKTVLLVSDPFHDERIRLMSSSLGLVPYVSPTRTSPIRGLAVVPYYAKETLEVAVGRIIGFRRLSRITAR